MAGEEVVFAAAVGDGLLRHVTILGRLTGTGGGRHLAVARSWLRDAEGFAGDRRSLGAAVGPADLPFVSNRSEWDGDTPPGGYLGEHPALPRSAVVRSYDATWTLILERGHAKGPVLRAVTWMCWSRDFPAAIRYLFDLQRAGFLFRPDTLREILDLAIRLRNVVNTDQDLARLVFPRVPETNQQWLEMPFQPGFGLNGREPPVADPLGASSFVLDEALETIRRARSAPSYDEWFVSQLNAAVPLMVAKRIVERFLPPPNLTLKAALDRVEEIMADAHSFAAAALGGPLLQPSFLFARGLSRELAALDPAGWRRRLLEERALLPDALRHLADDDDWLQHEEFFMGPAEIAGLPPEWRGISPRAAFPIVRALRDHEPSPWMPLCPFDNGALRRRARMPPDTGADERESRAIWERAEREVDTERAKAIALEERHQFAAAADTYAGVFQRYPWCDVLRDRAARARFLAGDRQGALEEITTAVLGRPLEPGHWWCLADISRMAGFPAASAAATSVQQKLLNRGAR